MRRSIALVLVLSASLAAVAEGQTCAGLPSFSKVPAHLSGSIITGNDITTIGGAVTWGGVGPFASAGAALVDFDGIDESAFTVGFGVGYQVSASAENRLRRNSVYQPSGNLRGIQFCPVAAFEYQKGPEFDFLGENIDLSAISLSAGLSLGVPIVAGTTLQLIPVGGVALAYTKVTADATSFPSQSDSETYGIISLGLGFLMNETLSIKPFVGIPVGLEGADPRLGIVVSFALGRRG